MDFAWAMKALGEGKKVTRRSLAGDPPIYLYWNKTDDTILRDYGARTNSKWHPSLDSLFAEDWEEYVEPKKAAPVKSTQEDLPVWPEVNADGYARVSKDSDVVVHDGVYRCKKEPSAKAAEDQIDYAKEARKIVDGLPEDYYKIQLIDALVDAFVDKISQRVARLLK